MDIFCNILFNDYSTDPAFSLHVNFKEVSKLENSHFFEWILCPFHGEFIIFFIGIIDKIRGHIAGFIPGWAWGGVSHPFSLLEGSGLILNLFWPRRNTGN